MKVGETTEYRKGGNEGAINVNEYAGEVTYIAVTAVESKSYKTLRGAEKFMARKGYERS